MRISDINWNSIIIKAKTENLNLDQIKLPAEARISFESEQKQYIIKVNESEFCIIPERSGKDVLDQFVVNSIPEKNICWILDITNQNIIIKICPFANAIMLDAFKQMQIEISTKVVEKLRKNTAAEAITAIEREFVYYTNFGKRAIFVIGINEFDKHKNEKAFIIISDRHRLTINKKNDKLVAENYTSQHGEVFQPVTVIYDDFKFVTSGSSSAISDACNAYLSNVMKNDGYLSLWNEYNNIEKILILNDAKEYGVCEYDSYESIIAENVVYKFHIKKYGFVNEIADVELDVTNDESILNTSENQILNGTFQNDIRSTYAGAFKEFSKGFLYIEDKDRDYPRKLPSRGYIFKSVYGDTRRLSRRNQAKNLIASGMSQLPNLGLLIDNGLSINNTVHNYPVMTSLLKQRLKNEHGEDFRLDPEQEHAIQIALNTSDIALIQGPPGTGKTTVISAIVTRYEEIFKKENNGEIPKILITSFQHVAVDNAIAKIHTSGLPADRFGCKRGEEDKRKATVDEWVRQSVRRIDDYVKTNSDPGVFNSLNELKNDIFAWKSRGEVEGEGKELLKKWYERYKLDITDDLRQIIEKTICGSSEKDRRIVTSIDDEIRQELCSMIMKLRTSYESFEDDGRRNFKDFIQANRMGLFDDIAKIIIEQKIMSVCDNLIVSQDEFNDYLNFVEELKTQYCIEIKKKDEIIDVGNLLNEVLTQAQESMLVKIENIEEAKCKILLDYKEKLLSGEAERIIHEYSDVKAATCQQCSSPDAEQKYDLVIVDEAARANPLDLFIPMAMGKKVVLVGDHKQLPHMIEKSIEQKIKQAGDSKLDFYKESFFEYLFKKLKKQGDETSPFAKACTINKNHRMIREISDFLRDNIYSDENLICAIPEETAEKNRISIGKYNNKPIVWINVSNKEYASEEGSRSKYRQDEIKVLFRELKNILVEDDKIRSVGIITFYSKQKDEIKKDMENYIGTDMMNRLDKIEIGTVDEFQGKEYDLVLLSCVRSNDIEIVNEEDYKRKVGFLRDENRLCVALSRGRNLLVVIGDEDTVGKVDIMNNLISYCRSGEGCYFGKN